MSEKPKPMDKVILTGSIYCDILFNSVPVDKAYTDDVVKSVYDNKLNTEIVGGSYELISGGSAVNAALVLAGLGFKPIFIGKVGNDALGSFVTENLMSLGVEPALITSDDVSTATSANVSGVAGTLMFVPEQDMAGKPNANSTLTSAELQKELQKHLDKPGIIYLGGVFKQKALLPVFSDIAQEAHESGSQVVLDHGRVTNIVTPEHISHLKDALQYVDIYLPSKDELLSVWDTSSIEEALESVASHAPQTIIVVKDGENGAVGHENGKSIHVPSTKIDPDNIVQLTGAGDTFNAGFIAAHSTGMSLDESIAFAHSVAHERITTGKIPQRTV